jgi:hypothetical protein
VGTNIAADRAVGKARNIRRPAVESVRQPAPPGTPLPPTTVVYVGGQVEVNRNPPGPDCSTVEKYLAASQYRHWFGIQAPNDDPAMKRYVTCDLYGNAGGHFAIVVNFGAKGIPPAIVEASGVLELAKALGGLEPLLRLVGIVR